MEKVNEFTSTGSKLIFHPKVVRELQKKIVSPVSLQVAPTSRCNLNCIFCSNANRDKHEDLSSFAIADLLDRLVEKGLKTVEWTGGGDPTQYVNINVCISYAFNLGLQQGLITNGIQLNKISDKNLERLHWIRISLNSLDYVDDIDIPKFENPTLGFSYVMNEKTDTRMTTKLFEYAKLHNPDYIRIVPNCQATHEEQEENNKRYSKLIGKWGHPFFYQSKSFKTPEKCYWGYLKPFVLHDGWVYPCSSVVLNQGAERTFHEKYRWLKMDQLLSQPMNIIPYIPESCSHCVFTGQNEMVNNIINPSKMINFI